MTASDAPPLPEMVPPQMTDLDKASVFDAESSNRATIGGEAAALDLFGGQPERPMRSGAEFSDCGFFRWTLTRAWGNPGDERACWIMLNPSTADDIKDDPTIRRCVNFSRAWGFGSLVVVNLYPYRSPSPAECRKWADWEKNGPDWYARDALWTNESVIIREAKKASLVVAAWGAIAWDTYWVDHIVEGVTTGEVPWPIIYCLGTTASGAPKHPLARGVHRVPNDQQPVLWRTA